MKKSLLILLLIAYFSPINAQNDVLIGLDASWKYGSRQQPLQNYSYQGAWNYDVGFSFMKRVPHTGIFWQTGLNVNKFEESIVDFKTQNTGINDIEKIKQKTIFKRYAAAVPLGVKIFFSDRKCDMFIYPSLNFEYYFKEKITTQENYHFDDQGTITTVNRPIRDQNTLVASARLAIGGHQQVSSNIAILLQLEGTYGLLGTATFKGNEPWSIGIRSGILYRL